METLHTVLRAMRGDPQPPRRDHLQVFREFLAHLDRIGRQAVPRVARATKSAKSQNARNGHRGR